LSPSFFAWSTNPKAINEYSKQLEETIFTTMEMGRQQYTSVIEMPVGRMTRYVQWKAKLEEDKAKLLQQQASIQQKTKKR
jgi:hypothetical protein